MPDGRATSSRVYLSRRWDRLGWDVFIYRHIPGGSQVARVVDGDLVFDTTIKEGEQPPPHGATMFFREDELRALVDAAVESLPADGSMAAHLKDAQTIRDRLLTMFEQRGIR